MCLRTLEGSLLLDFLKCKLVTVNKVQFCFMSEKGTIYAVFVLRK